MKSTQEQTLDSQKRWEIPRRAKHPHILLDVGLSSVEGRICNEKQMSVLLKSLQEDEMQTTLPRHPSSKTSCLKSPGLLPHISWHSNVKLCLLKVSVVGSNELQCWAEQLSPLTRDCSVCGRTKHSQHLAEMSMSIGQHYVLWNIQGISKGCPETPGEEALHGTGGSSSGWRKASETEFP